MEQKLALIYYMTQKFDLEDITLVPAILSDISSRSQVNIYTDYKIELPLICAPMDSVIDDYNKEIFTQQGILTCSIRKHILNLNQTYYSFIGISLEQFEYILRFDYTVKELRPYQGLLIDIANGHIQKLYELTAQFKTKFPNIPIMIGNIANPETYNKYCEILTSRDYIRLSIGSGSACLTGANLGVYYPMGSLIDECYTVSATHNNPPKIVADGGFRNYDDIIKALNLGADYVMLGGIFAKSLEACGDTYFKGLKVSKYKDLLYRYGLSLYRKYRGMSTKDVQRSIGKTVLKTSEGISFTTPVLYTLESWVENFKDYLRSAMSYSDCKDLSKFIGNRNFIQITQNAIKRYKK